MHKGRLEAFSDGVIAIIITIMVLELKVPHGGELADLMPLLPVFLSYVLSFLYLAIYWNNHHHLMQSVKHVSGAILWANTHLLFWLSLVPFVTAWSGENHFAPITIAAYSFVLLMAGLAYYILAQCLIAHHGKDSPLAVAVGDDKKGKLSLVAYVIAIVVSLWLPMLALALIALVAAMWLVPDKRIEKVIGTKT